MNKTDAIQLFRKTLERIVRRDNSLYWLHLLEDKPEEQREFCAALERTGYNEKNR